MNNILNAIVQTSSTIDDRIKKNQEKESCLQEFNSLLKEISDCILYSEVLLGEDSTKDTTEALKEMQSVLSYVSSTNSSSKEINCLTKTIKNLLFILSDYSKADTN